MNKRTALLAMTAIVALSACGKSRSDLAREQQASGATTLATRAATPGVDMIIHGGPILTMAGDMPTYAEAVVIDDGKIVFVGSDAEAMAKKTDGTAVKNLGGKLLMPGFLDPHSHFVDALVLADRVNVSSPPVGPVTTPGQIVETLQAAAKARALKPGELLIGYGYDDTLMPRGELLSRAMLDTAFPDNPVGVIHVSGHGAVINSRAMAKYGYKDGMADVEGGVILRNGNTQDLQGLVMEMAFLPMFSALPSPTEATEAAAYKAAQMLYAAVGVTTAQDGATHAGQLAQMQRVNRAGGLYLDLVANPFITDIEKITKTDPFSTWGKYNNRLKIGGCKVTIDGSPQGKTAWFTTPYLTGGPAGETNYSGTPGIAPAAVMAMAKTCYANNVQVLMHANGDAAVDLLLKAHLAAAGNDPSKDRRTVCIHCQFIRQDQIDDLARFKIIPSLFTDHTFFFGDTHIKNRGLAQASFISPMKSALAAGLHPTNHTDAFVAPVDQMMTVWTAVNRPLRSGGTLGADQRISRYQALQAITTSAAYQYGEEASKGSIEAGKRADLIVLSADPNKVAPMTIKDIKVVETIKDGKTIWPAT